MMIQVLNVAKPPVKTKIIFGLALLFSLIVAIQSSKIVSGDISLNLNHIVVFTFNYLVWASLISLIYGSLDSFRTSGGWRSSASPVLLFRLLLIIIIHLIISNVLYYAYLFSFNTYSWAKALEDLKFIYLRASVSRLIDLIVIIGLLKILENYKEVSDQKMKLVSLANQLNISELNALKAQLNPHFLFNSLHALHSLIGYDDTKAKSITIKISNLLRKNLDQNNKYFVTVEEEIDYLSDYMAIEQERFHDRLTTHIEVDEKIKGVFLPNMILQPLAENSLKHGISLMESGGKISISINSEENQKLLIKIENDMPSSVENSSVPSFGIGLSNLENRLIQHFENNFILETTTLANRFLVKIVIPQKSHE